VLPADDRDVFGMAIGKALADGVVVRAASAAQDHEPMERMQFGAWS
jgi:hypothetical protein